jgi:transcriptional regulator with XRE-family HTH domain
LERGARNPWIEIIEKLARALHVSVAKLCERAGNDRSVRSREAQESDSGVKM